MLTNCMYVSTLETGMATLVVVFLIAVIAFIANGYFARSGSIEKLREESEPASLSDKPLKAEKNAERSKEGEATRVVTSFTPQRVRAHRTKTPSEAEFKQIMVWDPPTVEVKICGYCGAEMGQLTSVCPACGQKNR